MENSSPKVRDVKMVRDVLVKPRAPLSFSSAINVPPNNCSPTLVPLTVFDLANYDCQIPILYAFHAPMPDTATLEDALSRTLYYYPHLAGKFVTSSAGWPCVLLDGSGARLLETHVPTTLEENLPFDPSNDLLNLVPPLHGCEHFQVQLNRFSCGGVAMGVTFHHRVADGQAISAFLVAWATMARGSDAPLPAPFHGREHVSVPRNPPRVDFPHHEIEFVTKSSSLLRKPLSGSEVAASLASLTIVSVHYSKGFIAKLKAEASGGDHRRRCSTFQCIVSHMWKKLTAVRGLFPDEYTTIRTAVNGRSRLTNPPIPQSYFGNLVLWAFPSLKAGELLRTSYAELAGVIRHSVAKVNDAYFRSFIDFGELKLKRVTAEDEEFVAAMPGLGDMLCPDIELNSWLGLQFVDVDFGSGTPCCFTTPSLPVEGLAILTSSCGDDGGANLFMAMKKDQAKLFREIAYSP